jgi:hypothetical protein
MPRFVILQHDHPHGLHYDFMLAIGDVLKTWSLAEPPTNGIEQTAELLPGHRLAYLDYEGPVSDNRGTVKQRDKGTYRFIEQTASLHVVELAGEKIRGKIELRLEAEISNRWKCLFTASQ